MSGLMTDIAREIRENEIYLHFYIKSRDRGVHANFGRTLKNTATSLQQNLK